MEVLNHSLWLVLSYQSLGFFFYTLYLFFQKKNTSRLIFGLFLLSFALSIFFIHLQLFDHNSILFIYYPLAFCFGLTLIPLFYLHHKSLVIQNYKLKPTALLHFLPFALMVMFMTPFWILITTNHPQYLNVFYGFFLMKGIPGKPTWMIEIVVKSIIAFQLLFYSFKVLKLYYIHLRQLNREPCDDLRDYLMGIKTFAAGFVIMMALLIFHRFIHISGSSLSSTLFILTLLILNIGLAYYGIHFEDNYLYECQRASGSKMTAQSLKNHAYPRRSEQPEENGKYNASCMCKGRKEELVEKLLLLMKEEEPFTDSKVRIDDIADMLGTNTKYLSQLINEHFEKNFHTFLNDYRCSKVIKLFGDSQFNNYSIEGIAETCGFKSRSTFVASFKRFSGKLPSVYRSSLRSKLK